MSEHRWSRILRTISNGKIGSAPSIMLNAVSMKINTPVRPTPALKNKKTLSLITCHLGRVTSTLHSGKRKQYHINNHTTLISIRPFESASPSEKVSRELMQSSKEFVRERGYPQILRSE